MEEKKGINLDYDYKSEYGDGDVPSADKNKVNTSNKNSEYNKSVTPDEVPRRDGPGGN